jgi:hypothetical protein
MAILVMLLNIFRQDPEESERPNANHGPLSFITLAVGDRSVTFPLSSSPQDLSKAENTMIKVASVAVLFLAAASVASASGTIANNKLCIDIGKVDSTLDQLDPNLKLKSPVCAPEIDPGSAMAGLTLLLGGVAVIRGRRSKKSEQ